MAFHSTSEGELVFTLTTNWSEIEISYFRTAHRGWRYTGENVSSKMELATGHILWDIFNKSVKCTMTPFNFTYQCWGLLGEAGHLSISSVTVNISVSQSLV